MPRNKTSNVKVDLFDKPRPDEAWPKEWGVHGQVLWKGIPLFNLIEDLTTWKPVFFLRADPEPLLKCNWGSAGSLEALIKRAHVAVEEFEKFIWRTQQRPKL